MEVTNLNFKELLPQIQETINKATFLAIDCEFSGLNVVSEINAYDTPKQYYEKVRKNYSILPVRNLSSKVTISTFFVDPSIEISPTNGFYARLRSGISYLNVAEETDYRDKLEERQKVRNNVSPQQQSDVVPIPEELQSVVDDAMKQLGNFLDTNDTEMELPKCNAFVRRLIYQTTGQKYKNKIILQTKQLQNKDRVLVATKFKSREEQEKREQQQFEEELATLDDFTGFTKVLRFVVDSGKLVVGHNMCLDFLHTIDKFLTPLPPDYEEFKECAHALFKNVLDTKFMGTSEDFKDLVTSTVLKDLLETVSKSPFQIPPVEIESQGYSIEDVKEHEAGYDAYITGLSFLSMWNYLGMLKELSTEEIFKDFDLLEPFLNKLFVMVLRDGQYINLAGQDPCPGRDHVFHLTFPKDWKLSNIVELFSPFGGVYVAWINETSAYVGLNKREQASVALSTLSQSDTYSIMTYSRRQAQFSSIKTPSPPLTYTNRRKRLMDSVPSSNKKMRINKGNSSRTVVENESESDETPRKSARKGSRKTFAESDAWE